MDFKDLLNEWANDAGVDAELVEGMVQIVEAHIADTNTKLTAEVTAQLTEKHADDLEAEKSKHKEDLEVKEKEYTEKQLNVFALNKERNTAIMTQLRKLHQEKIPTILGRRE